MKTWQAALAQVVIGGLQVGVAVQFIPSTSTIAPLANPALQLAAQLGLVALKAFVARANSNSDPNGNPLFEVSPKKFVSEPKRQ